MEQSLVTLKAEETKLAKYRTKGNTISVIEAVTGLVYKCNPYKEEYNILIGQAINRMFVAHGHGKLVSIDNTELWIDLILETYNYETPETILLFLRKAAKGDFGKFYGEPDIGTLREWFATFLGNEIIPARERHQQKEAIG